MFIYNIYHIFNISKSIYVIELIFLVTNYFIFPYNWHDNWFKFHDLTGNWFSIRNVCRVQNVPCKVSLGNFNRILILGEEKLSKPLSIKFFLIWIYGTTAETQSFQNNAFFICCYNVFRFFYFLLTFLIVWNHLKSFYCGNFKFGK